MVLYGWMFGLLDIYMTCYASVTLGILHFYLMEIDYKWNLQVRPYAYLPFPLAALAVGYYAYMQFCPLA